MTKDDTRSAPTSAAAATPAIAIANCLVCGGRMRPSSLQGLVKCNACGFVSANMTLTDAEVAALYDLGYFHGDEYLDYVAEEESLRLNFAGRLRTLQQVVPDLRERDIFEIGCAHLRRRGTAHHAELRGHPAAARPPGTQTQAPVMDRRGSTPVS